MIIKISKKTQVKEKLVILTIQFTDKTEHKLS